MYQPHIIHSQKIARCEPGMCPRALQRGRCPFFVRLRFVTETTVLTWTRCLTRCACRVAQLSDCALNVGPHDSHDRNGTISVKHERPTALRKRQHVLEQTPSLRIGRSQGSCQFAFYFCLIPGPFLVVQRDAAVSHLLECDVMLWLRLSECNVMLRYLLEV